MKIRKCLSYDDVLLVPQHSDIRSRREVSIGNMLGDNLFFELPVISSPMDTVTEIPMSNAMSKAGGFGIIHRYNTIEKQCSLIQALPYTTFKAAAVGITGDYYERAQELVASGARLLCLDVAHGHHSMMQEALYRIKANFDVHIMAGNVATLEGFNDLASWGADSVRCNIGGGSICSTRVQTGHGVPGLQTIFDCALSDYSHQTRIIADGGIKNSGDMVKALAAGADFVMIGSLLAGTIETPGEVFYRPDGSRYKTYRGMASKDAQHDWRNKTGSIEGVSTVVPFKGPVDEVLSDLTVGIRSGLSYSGARNILELQSKAVFVRQTPAGQVESSAHILRK